MPDRLFSFAIILLAAASTTQAEWNAYEALSDWNALPTAKTGITAGLASSYDRSSGNADYNHYESPPGLVTVDANTTAVTLSGPGVITRFWMPHAAANEAFDVKITIDGVLKIDSDSNTVLDGGYGYFSGPLVSTLIGGQVSYEPIAFQDSLTIETNNWGSGGWRKTHHYYQYNYQKLAPGTAVTPYSGVLTPGQTAARDAAVSMIDDVGENPAGYSPTAVALNQGAATIAPGGSLTLADLAGGGRIGRLNVKMDGASDANLDGLRVRVRYGGRAENAVDVPVSHFFGAGHQRALYKSLPLGTDGNDGFYSYWPMPYRNGVIVELYNATGDEGAPRSISIDSAVVEYDPNAAAAGNAGYLHAVYRLNEMVDVDGLEYHELLNVSGRGHYVGNLLYVRHPGTSRQILEGDDVIIVNAAEYLYGTGLEDAYNGGYYYNHVAIVSDDGDVPYPESGTGPYHGLLHMDANDLGDSFVRTDQYRWLIGDYVPFTDGIAVLIENKGSVGGRDFGSTAFYYLLPALGDVNGDGNVDNLDITPFVAALMNDEATFQGLYPAGEYWAADCSQDGNVDTLDITQFVSLLLGGDTSIPEPAGCLAFAAAALVLARRRLRPSRSSSCRV